MIKLTSILKGIILEDRCKDIADRKYDKPSAYKSGAIVRCRKGHIWKDLKEDESLHKWFKRQGAPGKTGGWVDCNTCKTVDGKKKCKSCGRQKGEKRSKYPSCRPTPSQCSQPGKGKKWGKTNENIFEESISKDKIFSFKYLGVRENNIDNTGDPLYTYTFNSDNNEYNVYFADSGGGVYERVFGTVERNLAPTKENIPFKIYRTVTAITLDFLDKINKEEGFKKLNIEPITSQRGAIVKKFIDTYIAPKYKVEYLSRGVVIKNK